MDRVIHAYGMQEGLDYTLFRPSTGSAPDWTRSTPPGRRSRVITQFLGHIVRGEPIKLVDGGTQKRAFTYIDDGIAALIKIIAYRRESPREDLQHRQSGQQLFRAQVATMMRDLALTFPSIAIAPRNDNRRTTSADYYGNGYQDVECVPKIANTCCELHWQPTVAMDEAAANLRSVPGTVAEARLLSTERASARLRITNKGAGVARAEN
jgi:nucleoside-diphosphate-sugar epimerase